LNASYPGKCNGHRGLIAWPPWLLDLTVANVFLWEHLKEYVYAVPPRTMKDLMARLQAAATIVDANMLGCVQENAVWYMAICLEMVRDHFIQLL
jgi:hypothetical protein